MRGCGKNMGHGEKCTENWLCERCETIVKLKGLLEEIKNDGSAFISAIELYKLDGEEWMERVEKILQDIEK